MRAEHNSLMAPLGLALFYDPVQDIFELSMILATRAGPQSQKWSDQQITVNPTGSIHKKAREKKFDPKKVDFDEGVLI